MSQMTTACLLAGGLGSNEIPQGTVGLSDRHDLANSHLPARLTIVALGNVYFDPPNRVEQTPDWEEFLEGHCEHQDPAMATWCDMVGHLMTDEEIDQWVETADQHLAIARNAQKNLIPGYIQYEKHELSVAAQTLAASNRDHWMKHGENPSGNFADTIMEAVMHICHPETGQEHHS